MGYWDEEAGENANLMSPPQGKKGSEVAGGTEEWGALELLELRHSSGRPRKTAPASERQERELAGRAEGEARGVSGWR